MRQVSIPYTTSEGEEEFSDVPVCLQGDRMMGSQGGLLKTLVRNKLGAKAEED